MLFVNLPLPSSYSFIVRCRNKMMIVTHNIYRPTQCYTLQAAERYHLKLSMACTNSSRYIPSNPEFFNYFDNLLSDDLRVTRWLHRRIINENEHSPTDHNNSFPNQTSTSSFNSAPSTPPNSATPSNFTTHTIIYT